MDESVDLPVLLGAARARVSPARPMAVESLGVAFVHVERDLAGSHQLRERPTRTAGVGDPDRLGKPQPSNAAGLAEEREAVRGERHQPVDGADQLDVAQRGQQPAGLLTSRGEVGGCERALRWMPARTELLDLLGLDQHRLVVVGTDPVGGVVLAEVHGAILMSEDRVDHLALLAGELGERGAARVLVDHRDERKADAGEGGDAGAPEAGADDDVLGANRALRRLDRPHASPLDADIGHVATAEGRDSASVARRASASAARTPLPMPSVGMKRPPMIRSGSSSGVRSRTAAGSSSSGSSP